MIRPHSPALRAVGALLVCILVPGIGSAAAANQPPFDLGLTLGGYWSDNVGLSSNSEESGAVAHAGLKLLRRDETRRLSSSVDINLGYQQLSDGDRGDQLLGGATALAILRLLPDVLEWRVRDDFHQLRENALGGDTPENRFSLNYFTTGPTLTVPMGPQMRTVLDAYYSIESASISSLGSNRAGGSLAMVRDIGGASSASLNGSWERRWMDESVAAPDTTSRAVHLTYTLTRVRTALSADVGYADVDDSVDRSGGVVGRLSVTRQVSPASSVLLTLERAQSDAGEVLRAQSDSVGQPTSLIVATSDTFIRRSAHVGWNFARQRTTLSLTAGFSDESFRRTPGLNRELLEYDLGWSRRIRPTLLLALGYGGSVERFSNLGGARAEETRTYLALDWKTGRTLNWQLRVDHRGRSGRGPVARFTENRAGLLLTWSPFAR